MIHIHIYLKIINMQAQYFHYKILETKPLSALEEFKDHHRLRVFHTKGCKCVECGIEAEQLALGEGRGQLHWDIYTRDFYPLTVDHILPKSKGGGDDLENLQPMCYLCNQRKGNGEFPSKPKSKYPCKQVQITSPYRLSLYKRADPETIAVGLFAHKRINKRVKELGIIETVTVNPHTNRAAVTIVDKPGSWYHIEAIYIKK